MPGPRSRPLTALPQRDADRRRIRAQTTIGTRCTGELEFSLYSRWEFQQSGAVTDAFPLDSKISEQSQVKIRQRRFFGIANVLPAFDGAAATAHNQQRNVAQIMSIALTHSGPIDQCCMVQQTAVAVVGRTHLFQQVSELRHMIRVDLFDLRDFFGLSRVMRDWMMRVRHSHLRIRDTAEFTPEHQRDDAGEVTLIGKYLQIAHQFHVLVISARNAYGMIDYRQILIVLFLGDLDASFHIAYRFEIFDELV